MGCVIKKEKQFSTININEQNTFYFVIINGEKELKKLKKQYRFSNSVPILGSISIIQHSVNSRSEYYYYEKKQIFSDINRQNGIINEQYRDFNLDTQQKMSQFLYFKGSQDSNNVL